MVSCEKVNPDESRNKMEYLIEVEMGLQIDIVLPLDLHRDTHFADYIILIKGLFLAVCGLHGLYSRIHWRNVIMFKCWLKLCEKSCQGCVRGHSQAKCCKFRVKDVQRQFQGPWGSELLYFQDRFWRSSVDLKFHRHL